jgi:hypothetical protein
MWSEWKQTAKNISCIENKEERDKNFYLDKTKIDSNDCKDYDWSLLLLTLSLPKSTWSI